MTPGQLFLEDWVMFQLLPVYYLLFFFGRHYFYKHLWPAAWADDNTCFTFCGRSAKSFFGGTGWMASLHASLFMGNLLWLATLNKSLTMFACGQLPNGDYYLVDDPTVTCYAGDHLKLMILAIAALCIYTLGWPLFLAVAFRIAFRKKLLLGSAQFAGLLGYLYKRFEIQWFWWHTIIIAHKLAIVLTKIFLFNTFYQCPIAIVVTLVMMVLQSFARAYESTMLDRLQMAGYSTQFCLLFLGLLFATDKGSSKLNNFLANTFFVMFWSMVVACSCAVYRDLKRYYRLDRLAAISAEHDLGMNPKEIVVSTLHAWVSREPSADEYARFREFLAARKKYTCPPHLKEPFLMLSKGATTLLEFMCYPAEHWESSAGTLGSKLLYFISKANENQSIEMQPGEVIKEEFDETLSSTLSFCLRDLKEQWHIRRQPDFEETDEPTYIADVFKESAGGDLLYFMCVCTEDERINAIESMKIITSDFTGLIECTLNEAVGLEPRHSFDPDEFDTHKAIVAIEMEDMHTSALFTEIEALEMQNGKHELDDFVSSIVHHQVSWSEGGVIVTDGTSDWGKDNMTAPIHLACQHNTTNDSNQREVAPVVPMTHPQTNITMLLTKEDEEPKEHQEEEEEEEEEESVMINLDEEPKEHSNMSESNHFVLQRSSANGAGDLPTIQEFESKMRVMIPTERETLYDQSFGMYDLDCSGLVDSEPEIRDLFMCLWLKCPKAMQTSNATNTAENHIQYLMKVLESRRSGFTKDEWFQWFECNVYLQYETEEI